MSSNPTGGSDLPGTSPVAGVAEQTCRECSGKGRIDGRTCASCGGTGKITEAIGGG